MAGHQMDDLLGPPSTSHTYVPDSQFSYVPAAEPGKTVDLSGRSSLQEPQPSSYSPGNSASFGSQSSGSGSYSSSSYRGNDFSSASSRGPSSFEGGGSGPSLSLSSLNPQNIIRELTSRPVTELVTENGRALLQVPQYMARAYSAAARKYLRPWNEFARLNPARIVEGVRNATRRGEIQIYVQRNVIANARQYCPNYAFIFLAMLFMFVATSPALLCMLAGVGGGWSHAMRSDGFRNRPWQLQIGGVSVPLGANSKMAIMSLPTLIFLHFFMGPVLWSAALCSGGVSLAHAALKDRDPGDKFEDHDDQDHGFGSNGRIRELP
eukprot:TRINITY_DN13772_c7_g1_i1.p1 TRINITY_DN13772_c7_g1~~TRINITY_DN13772_c7_g1_i1.p1  ORF type:complete len:322 (-),score=38.18 TRINITY_DN13772_c7_g1_i1:193-1158(-)